MQRAAIVGILAVLMTVFACTKKVPLSDVEVKNGIAYHKGEDKPFSGTVFSKFKNGKLKEEVSYRNGKLNGPFKVWTEFGFPLTEGEWQDGRKTGAWTEYYENGEKRFSGEYLDDREAGQWTYYDRGGNPLFTFGYDESCAPLDNNQMDELLAKVKSMPLEPVGENEVAVLETNFGKMVVEFFPDRAPQHCAAFKRLVKAGYYDCTTFHRVIKDFMIQGGDIATRHAGRGPAPDGPGYTLKAEFNDIPHDKGILSMARSTDPNSAGSQFFICLTRERTEHLDGQYTVFGRLIEGIDVLEQIGNFPVKMSPVYNAPVLPVHPVIIQKAYMQTKI